MTSIELIESYVADVAVQLPRKQRNDVAFELRALLGEQLQDKADTAGRSADASMTVEMLRGFGSPRDVAARYLPAMQIIDPVDARKFLRAAIVGLTVIWALGLLKLLQQPIHSAWDLLSAVGQWWGGVVIPSLWWPGLLVVAFATAAWTRRKWPSASDWKPSAGNRLRGGRSAMAMGVFGMLCGIYFLIEPRRVLDIASGGQAAPVAYQALTYTETFLHRQAPYLLALILLNIPMVTLAMVQGRWSAAMQTTRVGLGLSTCAVMTWTIMDGPILSAPSSNEVAKWFMTLIIAYTLVDLGIRKYRSIKPAPSQPTHGQGGAD